ncbi:hypothetical protein, partial [Proteus mirabilis]|uniref:hypothetical protein n=1 Tax=Proteus mirabilis TaxID=584 RepID=UPI0013D2F7E4
RYTDMPMLVRLRKDGDRFVPDRYVRQSDLGSGPKSRRKAPKSDRAAWKTVAFAEESRELVVPQGSIGYRWPED